MPRTNIILCFVLTCFVATKLFAQEPAGKYPITSTREIVLADLEGIELPELKIMRNEIFARHGHTFKGEDLKQYFGSQSWYKATVADATTLLTALEKKNADFIRKYETKIAASSDFNLFYAAFKKAASEEDEDKLAEMLSSNGLLSPDEFKESFMNKRAEIQIAMRKAVPRGSDTIKKLFFGEFYSGVQYKWVEFHKEGCCWVIYGIGMAG